MEPQSNNKRTFFPEAFFLGFVLIGSQVLLIREFLLVFNGNELVIGLLFSIWMLISALGAWLGRMFGKQSLLPALIRLFLIIVSVYPVIAAFGMEFLRNDFFIPGRAVSPVEIIVFSSLLLLPQCLAGGLAFNLINVSSPKDKTTMRSCYAYESLGSVVGGLLISLVFIYFLEIDNLKSLQYLALGSMIFFGITDFQLKKFFQSFVYLLAAIGFMHLIYNMDLNRMAKKSLFANQELMYTKETPFGTLVVTKTAQQYNFYENGLMGSTSDDAVFREENVHYAMLQRPKAKNVLLVGGSLSGLAKEVLKYPEIETLDVLETNPEIFVVEEKFASPIADQRVHRINKDPVFYLYSSNRKYDAIIINQPTPSNVQLNRLYTLEFFAKAEALLNETGVLFTGLSASTNYLSDEEVQLHSTIHNTLSALFNYVVILPGNRNYFLASNESLSLQYNKLLEAIELDNEFINSDYLDEDLLQLRSSQLTSMLDSNASLNLDYKPVAYLIYISHWLSAYGFVLWFLLGACLLITAIFLLVSKPAVAAMFTSGFTGAATEVSLIIAFQVIFGYAYLFIGIIITTFMAGLAAGAHFSKQCNMKNWRKMLLFLQFFSGIYLLVIALKLELMSDTLGVALIQTLFLLMILAISLLVGLQYGVSVCKSERSVGVTIAQIYSADLIGAATGSLLVVIWLIPVFGLLTNLVILGLLHFFTLALFVVKRKLKYF